MLCQASVQKVACGCHSQKEKGTAWINIGFRNFCGCFAWHFKQFENWQFVWSPPLGLSVRQGVLFRSSACVRGKDSKPFLERQKAEIVWQMCDCWHNFGSDREHSCFSFFTYHMDYQGSSEEKQLLLFPILQVPLCTEGKENGKSQHAKQEQTTKLSSKEGQMPADDWEH